MSKKISTPLATSTPLSPIAERLLTAQSLLSQTLSEQKRAREADAAATSTQKGNTFVKRAKVNTVPKASSTLSSQIYDKFKKSRSVNQGKKTVPKTKVVSKMSSPIPYLNSQESTQDPSQVYHGHEGSNLLSAAQINELKNRILDGTMDLGNLLAMGQAGITESSSTKKSIVLDSDEDNWDEDATPDNLNFEKPVSPSLLDHTSPKDIIFAPENQLGEFSENLKNDDLTDGEETPEMTFAQKIDEQSDISNHENRVDDESQQKLSAKEQDVATNGMVGVAGQKLNSKEEQNVVHSEHCCSPCRQLLLLILEKLNELLQRQPISRHVPPMRKIVPEEYPLLPLLPLKTHEDLVMFTTLLESNPEAVDQYMNLMLVLGGECPAKAIKNILNQTITSDLADNCTWKIKKMTKDGKSEKLVVGKFRLFEVISALITTTWSGFKDAQGIEVPVTRDANFAKIKDWVKRSSARL